MLNFKSKEKYLEEVDDGSVLEKIWNKYNHDRKYLNDCVAIWVNVNKKYFNQISINFIKKIQKKIFMEVFNKNLDQRIEFRKKW